MKRNIAIVAGGDSSEYAVSLNSAKGIGSFLDTERYVFYVVLLKKKSWTTSYKGSIYNIDRNDFSFTTKDGEKIIPDFAYITIHGTPGENGLLQGYFDLIELPYSTSSVLVEALTFNKFVLNNFLKSFGINISKSILIREGLKQQSYAEIVKEIGLPCFVKPTAGGSSFGVTKVKTEAELGAAIQAATKENPEVMIEQLMVGTEITCGCYKTKDKSVVFPITEVVTSREFFDYDAKYNGQVDEITPARIDKNTAKRVSELTSQIYDLLGCKGIIRIDYILSGTKNEEIIELLEVNTTPGMTSTSFIPNQVKAANLDIKDVMTDIIEDHF